MTNNSGDMKMKQPANGTIAQAKVEAFAGQVVNDVAAAYSGVMTKLGHRLSLYIVMAQHGPMRVAELAEKSANSERYTLEWLSQYFFV